MAPIPPSLISTTGHQGDVVLPYNAMTKPLPDWPTIVTLPSRPGSSEPIDTITVDIGSHPDEETPTNIFERSLNTDLNTE